jgi:acetolactate synthase I/II/III large subunit
VLMDVHVTKDENCYPMIAPGKSNAHMLGLPQKARPNAEFINCNSCGTTNPAVNKFCPECGTEL